jgi:hypothetical protein
MRLVHLTRHVAGLPVPRYEADPLGRLDAALDVLDGSRWMCY